MEAEAVSRVRDIVKQARSSGLTDTEIVDCFQENGYSREHVSASPMKKGKGESAEDFNPWKKSCTILNFMLFKLYPVLFISLLPVYPAFKMFTGSACLLTELSPFGEVVTPMADCVICEGVTEAPRLFNLSKDDFIRNYAYTSKPILVVGAVSHWSALEVFSYDYFKSIYMNSQESLEEDHNSGQFFAYSSNIRDLKDLFSLPSDMATMETEKWYIGWYV